MWPGIVKVTGYMVIDRVIGQLGLPVESKIGQRINRGAMIYLWYIHTVFTITVTGKPIYYLTQ